MKLLIYGMNLAPENTGIGKYTTEFAQWMAGQGHDVTVIMGLPHYPQWALYAGYRYRYARETLPGDVQVLRVPHFIPRAGRVSALARVLMESSFSLLSLRWWLPLLISRSRPDYVINICPPLQLALLPWIYSRLRRVPWILWVQDFQVDAAFRLGMLSERGLGRLLYRLEGFFLRRASKVVSISGPMCRRAIEKGARPESVIEMPNWANVDSIGTQPASAGFRATLGASPESLLVVYSGAIGEKQGLEIILEAAVRLRDQASLMFVIAGDGSEKAYLEAKAASAQLSNVRFLPVQSAGGFAELMAAADIQLIIQKAEAADLVMPSKLTNILASGRPCIATTSPGTAVAEVLQRAEAGLCVAPGNADQLAQALLQLMQDRDLRAAMGRSARTYAEAHLARDAILERFSAALSLRGRFTTQE